MFENDFGCSRTAKASLLLGAIILLQATVFPAGLVGAPIRVAVVPSETGTGVDNLLTAAAVRLADIPGIQLLDRENVGKVLAEQKLTLAGWVDPAQAIRIGKLLDVQLFAVIDAHAADQGRPGLVVFSAQTGARLWDAPLEGTELDDRVESMAAALDAARAKFEANPQRMKTVSLLTVRNADLPRSFDPLVEASGRWLERELLRSPTLTVLERTQMRQLSNERKLPTATPLPDLWASLRLIELEIGRGEGETLRGTARVTGSEGVVLSMVNVTVPGREPLAIADALARKLEVEFQAERAGRRPERREEAQRFSRESKLFWDHKEYDRALVAAEAAHALAPDDDRMLRWLAWVAGTAATEKIDPGRSTSGGRPQRPVSPEALAASLPLGQRALETLAELYVRQTRSPNWPKQAEEIPHPFLRTYLGKIASLPDLSEARQREVDALLAEYRTFLLEKVWPACRSAADGPFGYRNATSTLSGWILLDLVSTLSLRRSDWAADLAGFLRDWAAIAERQLAKKDPLELRGADYLLTNLRHQQQQPKLTPAAYQALSNAYADLSAKNVPLLKLRGIWLRGSLDTLAAAKPETRELAPTQEEIVARMDALRREAKALIADPQTPPDLRNSWIELVRGSFDQLPHQQRTEEMRKLCEFLLEHDIYHERTFNMCLLYYSLMGHEKPQAALALVDKTLDHLKQHAGGLTDKQLVQSVHQLQEKRTALQAKLAPTPVRNAPWESVRTIVDLQNDPSKFRAIVRPAIAGRQVAALGLEYPDRLNSENAGLAEFTLLRYPLDGGPPTSGGLFAVSDLPILEVVERSAQSGSKFVPASLIVGDEFVAATSGKGIVRFSLKDNAVHVLNSTQGLPSDHVQYLASDGRRLYAWLGKPRAESYLISCLPDGSELQVLASSRRAVKASPLDDATPSICRWMTWDAPHQRVVLHLVECGGNHASIWQYVPEGAFKRLFAFHDSFGAFNPPRQVGSDRLMMFDRTLFTTAPHADNAVALFDLRDDSFRKIYVRDYKLSRMGVPFTVAGETLWQSAPWGGLGLKDDRFEPFPPLREVAKTFDFQPGAACLWIGGDELLLADNSGLWLLKLRSVSPAKASTP